MDHMEPHKGDMLPSGNLLKEMYIRKDKWQIWHTQNTSVLFVSVEMLNFWLEDGRLEPGIFLPFSDGLAVAESEPYALISASDSGPYPQIGRQALDITKAFAYTRKTYPNVGLSHAFYLPQLPTLLFTENTEETEQDTLTLGRWLTGGINVPVTDGKRIRTYVPGITDTVYRDMLDLFGWEETLSQKIPAMIPESEPSQHSADLRRGEKKEGPFRLPGRKKLEKFFREQIIDVIEREEAYRRMGIFFPGSVLLVGPSGCGKTYAVEQLREYLGWPVYRVSSETIGSSYIHETGRLIAELFRQAMADAPSIVIMDELEAYLSTRKGSGMSNQYYLEEMAEFLRILPELPKNKVLLFGMTNMKEQIDPAITRKGRFDHILEVSLPSDEEILALIEDLLKDVPKEKDLDLETVAVRFRQRPISDIVFTVREAGRLCVVSSRERIDQTSLLQACMILENENIKDRPRRNIGFLPEDTIC